MNGGKILHSSSRKVASGGPVNMIDTVIGAYDGQHFDTYAIRFCINRLLAIIYPHKYKEKYSISVVHNYTDVEKEEVAYHIDLYKNDDPYGYLGNIVITNNFIITDSFIRFLLMRLIKHIEQTRRLT